MVWWDEKSATGYVVLICETSSESLKYGMEEPFIWINYDGKKSSSGRVVCYPERLLEDQGIEKIDKVEKINIKKAICAAKSIVMDQCKNSYQGVFWGPDSNHVFGWKIIFFTDEFSYSAIFVDPANFTAKIICKKDIGIDIWC